MKEKAIRVYFRHPETDAVLEAALSPETRFEELDALLYAEGFVAPQKPGYAYLASGILCPARHRLADYLPEGAEALELRVFGYPMVI